MPIFVSALSQQERRNEKYDSPLIACGVLKIAYDVALLAMFRHTKPPEEIVN